MKCENCKKETHVAYVDDDHRKVCPDCYNKCECECDGKDCKNEKSQGKSK